MDTKIFYHEALQADKLHQSISIDQKILNSNIEQQSLDLRAGLGGRCPLIFLAKFDAKLQTRQSYTYSVS